LVTLVIGIEQGQAWILPKSDEEIVALGQRYVAHESGLEPSAQLAWPPLADMAARVSAVATAQEAARQAEYRRSSASNEFHNALRRATPLLREAILQLKWTQRHNLGALERWGLATKLGTRRGVVVTSPRNEAGWAAFLQSYAKRELSLPEAERLTAPDLAQVQALAQQAATARTERDAAQSQREIATSQVAQSVGPLLDWLQLALGVLVLTRFDRQVTPALAEWGYKIIERRRRQRKTVTVIDPHPGATRPPSP